MAFPVFGRIREMEPSLATLLLLTIGAVAVVGLAAAVTAPSSVLVGESQWELISAFHGMGATVFLIASTIAVYLSWRLYSGQLTAYKDLRWLAALSTLLAGVTVAFGNWIYIGYRGAGGPRSFFLANMPEVHAIFFEFKEFIALFTIPTMVAATFLIWKYGPGIVKNQEVRAATGILFFLGWVFLLLAYLLGAAITKLKAVA